MIRNDIEDDVVLIKQVPVHLRDWLVQFTKKED